MSFFFFFNDTATTEIYTLSLHDALPISHRQLARRDPGESGGVHGFRNSASPTRFARVRGAVESGERRLPAADHHRDGARQRDGAAGRSGDDPGGPERGDSPDLRRRPGERGERGSPA